MENRCFICNKTSGKAVYKQNGFESRSCPECGLLYCNPLPNDEQVNFEKDFHRQSFYKNPSRYKARWLSERTAGSTSLLEVGAGDGHLLNEFANYGFRVTGLEPNLQRSKNIKDYYGRDVCQGFLESFDFGERKYDVIFHVDLLAHFPDPFLAIQKMKNITKEDGYISFEVGVVGGISTFWYRFFSLGLPQHRWLHSEKSLDKFLKKADLITLNKTVHSLAPYLILGRLSNLLLISVLRRLLNPFIGSRESFLFNLNDAICNFLRYNVGRHFPNFGPLTIFYLTKPS